MRIDKWYGKTFSSWCRLPDGDWWHAAPPLTEGRIGGMWPPWLKAAVTADMPFRHIVTVARKRDPRHLQLHRSATFLIVWTWDARRETRERWCFTTDTCHLSHKCYVIPSIATRRETREIMFYNMRMSSGRVERYASNWRKPQIILHTQFFTNCLPVFFMYKIL